MKLSQFKEAAGHVEALRRLRKFRQAYGNGDLPSRSLVLELDGVEQVTLLASTRSEMCKVLSYEEASITAALRGLGVIVDTDLPL